eukprot:3879250-Rhodomonas_salina.1
MSQKGAPILAMRRLALLTHTQKLRGNTTGSDRNESLGEDAGLDRHVRARGERDSEDGGACELARGRCSRGGGVCTFKSHFGSARCHYWAPPRRYARRNSYP